MKNKTIRACLLSAAFAIFTVLVMTADVQPIGPNESVVGLASLNGAVASALGFRYGWYMISEITGYLALAVMGLYALAGLLQLLKRKSLSKVDRDILVLGGLYAAVAFFYVLFDKLAINYRPVLLSQEPEPSYPSSHTLLAVTVFLSAVLLERRGRNSRAGLFEYCLWVCAILLVVSRFMSGVHWATDILAGLLFSGALLCWFELALDQLAPVSKKTAAKGRAERHSEKTTR
ncbi:MAG: phosphatase PAP2 family protein [Firmicutes bacterium]|nr:phosphatase PAP2 family protein [Bacillota bacterium]